MPWWGRGGGGWGMGGLRGDLRSVRAQARARAEPRASRWGPDHRAAPTSRSRPGERSREGDRRRHAGWSQGCLLRKTSGRAGASHTPFQSKYRSVPGQGGDCFRVLLEGRTTPRTEPGARGQRAAGGASWPRHPDHLEAWPPQGKKIKFMGYPDKRHLYNSGSPPGCC